MVRPFRERFIAWLARLDQTAREIMLASLMLASLLVMGSVGYHLLEGWTLMEGLYMTFITLTTIGFGEIHELSNLGRVFTIIIGLTGIGTVAFVAGRAAQLLLASEALRQRHMLRKIRTMKNHYILCGYGRIGRRVAEDLQHAGQDFVVIDHDEERIEALQDAEIPCVLGDAEDDDVLQEAGIERAAGLIITLPEDSTNVFVTLVARELNPDLLILARTSDEKNRRKLFQAGASKVVAPSDVGADRMAQVILRPNVDRFMEQVLKTSALGLQMEEVHVEEGAPLAGKTLAASHFRQQFDAIVIAVIKNDTAEMTFNPSPHDRIEAGDVLIVLGSSEMIRRLRREGCMVR